MAFTELSYEKVWTSPEDFPTIETNETKVREDMQYHPDVIKNFINRILLPEVTQAIEAGGGGGGGVPDDGSVTTAKIVDGAVTNAKLANSSVTTAKLAAGSVTLAKLAQEVKDYIAQQAGGTGPVKLKDYTLPAGTHDFAIDVSDIDWSAYRTVRIQITGLVAGNNINDTRYRILFNNLVPSDTEGDSTYNLYMVGGSGSYTRARLCADNAVAPQSRMGTSSWYEMTIRGGPGVSYINFRSEQLGAFYNVAADYATESSTWGAVNSSNLKLSGLNTINFVEEAYSDGQGGTIGYGIAAGARVCIYGEPI